MAYFTVKITPGSASPHLSSVLLVLGQNNARIGNYVNYKKKSDAKTRRVHGVGQAVTFRGQPDEAYCKLSSKQHHFTASSPIFVPTPTLWMDIKSTRV